MFKVKSISFAFHIKPWWPSFHYFNPSVFFKLWTNFETSALNDTKWPGYVRGQKYVCIPNTLLRQKFLPILLYRSYFFFFFELWPKFEKCVQNDPKPCAFRIHPRGPNFHRFPFIFLRYGPIVRKVYRRPKYDLDLFKVKISIFIKHTCLTHKFPFVSYCD